MEKERNKIKMLFVYLILSCIVFLMVGPFIYILSTSLKSTYSFLTKSPFSTLLKDVTWNNYKDLVGGTSFLNWIFNSVVVTGLTILIILFIDSLAGYVFARKEFPGKNLFFILILSTLIIPFPVTFIPVFLITMKMRLINTYPGLIIPGLAWPVGVFMMKQFIQSIPSELEDSARIDGCSEFQIYWKIILPLCKPALAVLGIYTGMWQWNNFLWPLVATTTTKMRTLTVGLAVLQGGQFVTNWGVVAAGAIISLVPLYVLFLFFQKYFIKGLTVGALKG